MAEIDKNLLRKIPKVDDLLMHPDIETFEKSPPLTATIRDVLEHLRAGILDSTIKTIPHIDTLAQQIVGEYKKSQRPNLKRVINATGVILHTNLGRAPLAKEATKAVVEVASGYSNLEYDLEEGRRGKRHSHVDNLLMQLTGAESAMVVNNNAAAVLLALSAITAGRDVIISRGELVEIGGSFRIPDVMIQSGCRLIEVGTTNKTHLADYERAIESSENIGAILRVHTSNFKIVGFTSSPSIEELSALAKKSNIPFIEDLGSGSMPMSNVIPDVVTFSGDKLLGGPQAGIIIGAGGYIEKMKEHPLARAMRIDKLSLVALESTLRLYLDPKTAAEKIPTLRMLNDNPESLHQKAKRLQSLMGGDSAVVTEHSQAGGGAMPEENLPSYAVSIDRRYETFFRKSDPAIIGRIYKDRFLLDVRTIEEEDFPYIAKCFKEVK